MLDSSQPQVPGVSLAEGERKSLVLKLEAGD
jgi:hypothetical protein